MIAFSINLPEKILAYACNVRVPRKLILVRLLQKWLFY